MVICFAAGIVVGCMLQRYTVIQATAAGQPMLVRYDHLTGKTSYAYWPSLLGRYKTMKWYEVYEWEEGNQIDRFIEADKSKRGQSSNTSES